MNETEYIKIQTKAIILGIIYITLITILILGIRIKYTYASDTLLATYEISNQDDNATLASDVRYRWGIAFITPNDSTNHKLTTVKFALSKIGSPTGTYNYQLWSIGSGTCGTNAQPGTLLAETTNTGDPSSLTGTPTFTTLTFNSYSLTANTCYGLVVHYESGSEFQAVLVGFDNSVSTFSGNTIRTGTNTTWTNTNSQEAVFEAYYDDGDGGGGGSTSQATSTFEYLNFPSVRYLYFFALFMSFLIYYGMQMIYNITH
jgi:hypothetical protein